MLERWTRAVIRLRFFVLACWFAIMVVGMLSAVQLPPLLSTSLAVPGTSSQQADTTLAKRFGENPEGTFTVVFQVRGTSPRTIHSLTQRLVVAARALPGAHVGALRAVAGIVYGDVVTGLDLQRAQRYTESLRRALERPGLPAAYVTGAPAIQHDVNGILAADLRRGELFVVPAALCLLTLVLGIRAALLVPLIFAASTITAALAIVYAVAHVVLMASYAPNLVELVGLGLAIDYSLLFVQRFREEVKREGTSVDDAIVRTMASAGRAVCFSGAAVAIGLSVVLIVPIPFIRSLGIAGVIVPLVSIAAALTIQPALLSLLRRGDRRDGRLPWVGKVGEVESQFWPGLARTVIRRRLIMLSGAVAVMAALAAPAVSLKLTPGALSTLPQSVPAGRGLALLRDRVGPGAITPIDVVLDGDSAGSARSPAASTAVLQLAERLLRDPEVFIVAIGPMEPYVDLSGRYRRLIVMPRHEFGAESSQQLVRRLRGEFIPATHFPPGFHISTGGVPAQGVDFLDRVYGTFPWIVLAALLLAYFVLLRAFRSLILPLVALLLDVISVAATYGVLVVIFQLGVGAQVAGLYRTAQIEGWIPVFLFATLFGLSMDYQVFLVTRMRESWDEGAGSTGAVANGLRRTGRIVSAAAMIMVVSFSGFIAGHIAGLQELGVGLALGVLLDATIVRILLMPSVMVLLGRWCWWLPTSVARVTRVEASPLAEREGRDLSKSA